MWACRTTRRISDERRECRPKFGLHFLDVNFLLLIYRRCYIYSIDLDYSLLVNDCIDEATNFYSKYSLEIPVFMLTSVDITVHPARAHAQEQSTTAMNIRYMITRHFTSHTTTQPHNLPHIPLSTSITQPAHACSHSHQTLEQDGVEPVVPPEGYKVLL